MKLLWAYLRGKARAAALFFCFFLVFLLSFYFCQIPLAAILYPSAICALIGAAAATAGFFRERRKHLTLSRIRSMSDLITLSPPSPDTSIEKDYLEILRLLREEHTHLDAANKRRFSDMVDYYTVWAHQIKTPITAMRLNLQSEDTDLSRKLSADLFRIEQYSEMVMAFLRLDSDSTDYLIRKYDLDSIIRQSVRKFAGEFISRKLTLNYQSVDLAVVTDEKWLAFVIEQLLSNALKYTPEGSISIYLESPAALCIADTGIGIDSGDLPRIFENGFTGQNGRTHKKASGIGLYLCKRVCRRLGHGISAESRPGLGTVMRLDLSQREISGE